MNEQAMGWGSTRYEYSNLGHDILYCTHPEPEFMEHAFPGAEKLRENIFFVSDLDAKLASWALRFGGTYDRVTKQ